MLRLIPVRCGWGVFVSCLLVAHAAGAEPTGRRRVVVPILSDAPEPLPESSVLPARPPPREPPPLPPHFGGAGQLVIEGELDASASTTTVSGVGDRVTYGAAPGLDYFVFRHLSVGLATGVSFRSATVTDSMGREASTKEWRAFAGPRIGVNLPLSRDVSVFPRVWLGVSSEVWRASTDASGLAQLPSVDGGASRRRAGVSLRVFVPLLVHARQARVFVGLGPYLDVAGAGAGPDGASRTIGAMSVLGGTVWGPDPPPDADAPAQAAASRPRFGGRGGVVLAGNLGVRGGVTTYDQSTAEVVDVRVAPSADVFVVDRLSVGAALGAEISRAKLENRVLGAVHTSTTWFASPRVGIDVPITSWLDVYPRAGFTVGMISSSERSVSLARTDRDDSGAVYGLSLHVSVLAHIAPHAFVGAGPTVEYRTVAGSTDPFRGDAPHGRLAVDGFVGFWL